MRKLTITLILVLLSVAALNFVVIAQEQETPNTLEQIASAPEEFYGQTVTFDAYVSEFLNSQIFVASENALFDNDMVLIMDDNGEPFHMAVTKGAQVRITGTVYESLDVLQADRRRQEFEAQANNPDATPATVDTSPETPQEPFDGHDIPPLQFFYDGHLRDGYNVFTVIVVESPDDVQVLVGADNEDIALLNTTGAIDEADDTDMDETDDTDTVDDTDMDEAEETEAADDRDETDDTDSSDDESDDMEETDEPDEATPQTEATEESN
jgi:hypothetical protein